MSFITLKSSIKSKLESISEIQQVADYPTEDFNGFPAAAVRTMGNTSDYETTTENDELYSFLVYLFNPLDNPVNDRIKVRSFMEELCDTVRDAFDSDEFLSGISMPSGRIMIGIRPTVSLIDESDNGKFITAEIVLDIRVSKNIN